MSKGPVLIDSCGLDVRVRMQRWTRACGGGLSLAAPQRHVRRVLEIIVLIDVFRCIPAWSKL